MLGLNSKLITATRTGRPSDTELHPERIAPELPTSGQIGLSSLAIRIDFESPESGRRLVPAAREYGKIVPYQGRSEESQRSRRVRPGRNAATLPE